MTSAENVAVLATSGPTAKKSNAIGYNDLFEDSVASFGVQRDDEAIQRRDKSSSHRRAAHLAAATSSREYQLVSPTFFEDGKMSLKRMIGMLILMSMRRKSKNGWKKLLPPMANGDDWDEEFPQYDVDLEEQFGSLETSKPFPTTELENASSDIKSAARRSMDARKLVAQVKPARRIFLVLGVGAFDGLQSMTPRVPPPHFGMAALPTLPLGWGCLASSFFWSCCLPPLGGDTSAKKSAPAVGEEGREHHYIRERGKQHHPKKEEKQHHPKTGRKAAPLN